jgi:hypothetical protein
VSAGANITTGGSNICIGREAQPTNATDSNQFIVGSATYPAGAVNSTAPIGAPQWWTVKINGTDYKIQIATP